MIENSYKFMDATLPIDDNFQYKYDTLLRFLSRENQKGYLFAMADDQRYVAQINANMTKDLGVKGLKLKVLYLQPDTDQPLFYQVKQAAAGSNALVIANIYAIITANAKGTDRLIELNYARESFWELGIPIVFWVDKHSLNLIANRAPDLFSQRRLGTVHFTDVVDGHVQEQLTGADKDRYISTERFKELEADTHLLEKRHKGAIAADYPSARIVSEIALPLAKNYAEMGMRPQAQELLSNYEDYLATNVAEDDLIQLADIYKLLHDYDLAIATLLQANDLLTRKLKEYGAADEYIKSILAFVNGKLGEYYETIGALEDALKHFEAFNLLEKELLAIAPDSPYIIKSLAISYEKSGGVYEKMGDLPQALKHYEDAVILFEELNEAQPHNESIKNGLAVLYSKFGGLYETMGDLTKAQQYYENTIAYFRDLYEIYTREDSFKNGLAVSNEKLGGVYEKMGELTKAMEHYEEAVVLFEELYDTHPRDIPIKNGMAISYIKLGGVYKTMDNLNKALEYYEDAVVLFKELNYAYPRDVSFKNSIAISYLKIGKVYETMGNLAKAFDYYRAEAELFKELYEVNPDNVAYKNGFAVSYCLIGDIYKKEGNLIAAKQHYLQAQNLWREIAKDRPGIAETVKNLNEVGQILESL